MIVASQMFFRQILLFTRSTTRPTTEKFKPDLSSIYIAPFLAYCQLSDIYLARVELTLQE